MGVVVVVMVVVVVAVMGLASEVEVYSCFDLLMSTRQTL